ncbi:hypothetical protein [Roseobacter weihaiensis]|uniref:hypothetical protein n=1 Tax=Roseobacter weihaiensis TaxID=2763262 RepID=UPI001D0B1A7E|nr:hypothetical protein [Roseobacter sp. H9]
MKHIVKVLIFLLLGPSAVQADYGAMTLFQMLLRADWIVTGEIVASDAETYRIAVKRSFRPSKPTDTLMFRAASGQDYPALHDRWETGQHIMLMAQAEAGVLDPLGLVDEGAMLIRDGAVLVPSLAGQGPAAETISLPQGKIMAVAIPVELFHTALAGFFHCYRADGPAMTLRRLCTSEALTAYKSQSWLAEYLSAQAERRIGKEP